MLLVRGLLLFSRDNDENISKYFQCKSRSKQLSSRKFSILQGCIVVLELFSPFFNVASIALSHRSFEANLLASMLELKTFGSVPLKGDNLNKPMNIF